MDKNDHINTILAECRKQGILHAPSLSYILATVRHETAGTYQPINEIGGRRARYAPYYGRGYVQLTWMENYARYSHLLGQDFVRNPDAVKEPKTAAFILVHGFRLGTFTGRRLSQYVRSGKQDFVNARRCINGLDKAALIAGYAEEWLDRLPQFRVAARGGEATLHVLVNTVLKQNTRDSSRLPPEQKLSISKGSSLLLLAYLEQDHSHIKVTLNKTIQGYNTWLVYAPHVQIL